MPDVSRGSNQIYSKIYFMAPLQILRSAAPTTQHKFMVDVSDIFYFFCSGRRTESEAPGGGGGRRFFIENPRRGGLPGGWERGVRGREGVFAGNLGGGGGAKNIFFLGSRNVHPAQIVQTQWGTHRGKGLSVFCSRQPVDPVVGDPVRQDSDKI